MVGLAPNATFDESYCAGHTGAIPGEYVLLTVSDSGCGMDEETLKNIFEPFFTTKREGEGTGLGLATVYGIVKQNNGSINVYSEPGKGTTFRIYLPRFAGAEGTKVTATAAKPPHGTGTVLLVEDEKSIRITTDLFLKDLGYTVLVAENPKEALVLASEHPDQIDLLITDVIMPGMSGRDLANRLLQLRPTIEHLFRSRTTFAASTFGWPVRAVPTPDRFEFPAGSGTVLCPQLPPVKNRVGLRLGRSLQQRRIGIDFELAVLRVFVPEVITRTDVLPFIVQDLEDDGSSREKLITIEFTAKPADETEYGIYGVVHRKRLSVYGRCVVTTPIARKPLSSLQYPLIPTVLPRSTRHFRTPPNRGEHAQCRNAFNDSMIAA